MTADTSFLTPKNITVIGQELAILWSDGLETYLPLKALRLGCPCALCGGEPDLLTGLRPIKSKDAKPVEEKSFLLRSWRLIGGYSLQPHWADGHDSGLYSYDYLRRLPQNPL